MKTILVQKILWVKRSFVEKKFWSTKIMTIQNWVKKIVKIESVTAETFLIWTNDASTFVNWTNVIMSIC